MTHHHEHHHDVQSDLTFEERMIKLLDHWQKHNDDHAQTYMDWAEKAKTNGLLQIAELLIEINQMTLEINAKFEEAAEHLR